MAAGKSTVVAKLQHQWEGAVVIEADNFKMCGAGLIFSATIPYHPHAVY